MTPTEDISWRLTWIINGPRMDPTWIIQDAKTGLSAQYMHLQTNILLFIYT